MKPRALVGCSAGLLALALAVPASAVGVGLKSYKVKARGAKQLRSSRAAWPTPRASDARPSRSSRPGRRRVKELRSAGSARR